MVVVSGVILIALVASACGEENPPVPTSTTGTALPPRTTLPPVVTTAPSASTTTTVPAEVATEVDACALVEPQEIRSLAGERPGPGSPVPAADRPGSSAAGSDAESSQGAAPEVTVEGSDQGPPTLLVSSCSWPTDGPPAVILSYLAPTTSASALVHLQRLIDLDSRFARGGRVFPLAPDGDLGPAALLDESGAVIEVAVVTGSALLYVVPTEAPPTGTPEANALVELLLAAARRAPG
jgi:hypothetical protein